MYRSKFVTNRKVRRIQHLSVQVLEKIIEKFVLFFINEKLLIGSWRGFLKKKILKELRIHLASTLQAAITVSVTSDFNLCRLGLFRKTVSLAFFTLSPSLMKHFIYLKIQKKIVWPDWSMDGSTRMVELK